MGSGVTKDEAKAAPVPGNAAPRNVAKTSPAIVRVKKNGPAKHHRLT
jgi:hypothetical protein